MCLGTAGLCVASSGVALHLLPCWRSALDGSGCICPATVGRDLYDDVENLEWGPGRRDTLLGVPTSLLGRMTLALFQVKAARQY